MRRAIAAVCVLVPVALACQAPEVEPPAATAGAAGVDPSQSVVTVARESASCPDESTTDHLYLADRPSSRGARLVPISPDTLDDLVACRAIETVSPAWNLSADGLTLVTTEYDGRADQITRPEQITYVVRDAATGAERARFHPPDVTTISDLSPDGSLLLLQRRPMGEPRTWFLVSASGELQGTADAAELTAWGPVLMSPDARCLVHLLIPSSESETGPWPASLSVYDLVDPARSNHVSLANVLAGTWQSEHRMGDQRRWTNLIPGLALSPDGRTIAIAHADEEAITVVDLERPAVVHTTALQRPPDVLDLLGLRPRAAHAKVVDGAARQAVFGPDGRYLYVWGDDREIRDDGRPMVRYHGLKRVEVATGRVAAEALDGQCVDWVAPSDVGDRIYVSGPEQSTGAVHMGRSTYALRVLDAVTLRVLSERKLKGYRQHALVANPGMVDHP
ncbi:MAG: hypothetical protein GEU73_10605 [Chloroflexi bacterium]|nr:hypothetical protein [Chloroflexota bacterium]